MFDFRFGDTRVTRIVEMEMPMLGATTFFPDWDGAAIEPHRHWMVPRHFDPVSGNVVINIQAFLIRTPRHTILVDTCVGEDKQRHNPAWTNAKWPWLGNLHAHGVRPEDVDFVIPGNDDALRSLRLFLSRIADAAIAGRGLRDAAQHAPPPDASAASANAAPEKPEPAPAPGTV